MALKVTDIDFNCGIFVWFLNCVSARRFPICIGTLLPVNAVSKKEFNTVKCDQFSKFVNASRHGEVHMGRESCICHSKIDGKQFRMVLQLVSWQSRQRAEEIRVSRLGSESISSASIRGLRYDDLYDEMYDFDIMEALHRLPIQVQDLRNQRLKRAMDCGFKHSYLDKEMQAKQTPYEFYLQDMLAQVTMERREREAQGSYMPYELSQVVTEECMAVTASA